jgi:hypothetical protein
VSLQLPYAYLVCVEKVTPWANHSRLETELRQSHRWWHYMTGVWLVLRYETLLELHDLLVPVIQQEDHMLILPAKRPAGGWLPKDAWDWIEANLPRDW